MSLKNRQTAVAHPGSGSAPSPTTALPKPKTAVQPLKPSRSSNASKAPPSSGSSKQEAVLALLRRPEGATLTAMMEATGWQPHSVRGFLAGIVRKKLKLKLESNKVADNRIYRIGSGKLPRTGPSRKTRSRST